MVWTHGRADNRPGAGSGPKPKAFPALPHSVQCRLQICSVPEHGRGGCTRRYRPSLILEKSKLPGGGEGAMFAVGVAFAGVVAVVAFLAECGQVALGIVGRVVVEVSGG